MTAIPASTAPTQIRTQGAVSEIDTEYFRTKVTAALRHAPAPVLFVRGKLALLPDPAARQRAIAQVNIDLNGRLVRSQAARETLREAIDEVHQRLQDRLKRTVRDWQAIRGRRPTPDHRAQTRAAEQPRHLSLPSEHRQIVRRKTVAPHRMTVDDAVLDMNLLDYQFHLFIEAGSGNDSVVYVVDNDVDDNEPHYRVSQLNPQPDRVMPGACQAPVSPDQPPTLSSPEAVERLNLTGRPFVFFRDAASKRGCVLYHRYDGNYGLIGPIG